jgi:hypothetical protein
MKHNLSKDDNNEQAGAKKKIRVQGAPRARILLENMTSGHDMWQQTDPFAERALSRLGREWRSDISRSSREI